MQWTNAQLGAMLTKNRDRTDKAKPILWLPGDKPVFIPDDDKLHGRPLFYLTGDRAEDTFAIMIFRERLVGVYQGIEKTLVSCD